MDYCEEIFQLDDTPHLTSHWYSQKQAYEQDNNSGLKYGHSVIKKSY